MLENRSAAKVSGDKFYFTGKPCTHGHISKRQTSNGCCYDCSLAKSASYAANNQDKRRERHARTKDRRAEIDAIWRANNIDKIKQYRLDTKPLIRQQQKAYYEANKAKISEWAKGYYEANRARHTEYSRKRYAKMRTDPTFRIVKVMRQSLRRLAVFEKGGRRTFDILGYGVEELKTHLESLFTDGMNWENYGDWHIDHIKPIAVFIREGMIDPREINKLSNLQPLWAKDNMSKSDFYEV